MHESEAMDFITSVLRGFLERNFSLPFEENQKCYIPLIKTINAYIEDGNGHWVKEKSVDVIHFMENLETIIFNGGYKPETPKEFVDIVLSLVQEEMQKRIDVYKTEKNSNPKTIHDFFSFTLFAISLIFIILGLHINFLFVSDTVRIPFSFRVSTLALLYGKSLA